MGRERESGWIEEEETPPANPALCAFTAAPEAVFCREDPLGQPKHTRSTNWPGRGGQGLLSPHILCRIRCQDFYRQLRTEDEVFDD